MLAVTNSFSTSVESFSNIILLVQVTKLKTRHSYNYNKRFFYLFLNSLCNQFSLNTVHSVLEANKYEVYVLLCLLLLLSVIIKLQNVTNV